MYLLYLCVAKTIGVFATYGIINSIYAEIRRRISHDVFIVPLCCKDDWRLCSLWYNKFNQQKILQFDELRRKSVL